MHRIVISASSSVDRQFGGGQTYVRQLARELKRREYDVSIISWDGLFPGNQPWRVEWREIDGIRLAGVAVSPVAETSADGYTELGAARRQALRSIVDELQPDLMHINGMIPPLVSLCRELSIPHMVTAHHAGEVCPNGILLRPDDTICQEVPRPEVCVPCVCRQKKGGGILSELLACLPRIFYRPAGATLNQFRQVGYAGRVLMYPWLVERKLEGLRVFHEQAQRIIAPSRTLATALERSGVPRDRIRVIPHGIQPFAPQPIPPFDGRPVRFGFVGRVDRAKGLHILFQAFAMLPEALSELHIIGDAQSPLDAEYFRQTLRLLQDRKDLKLHGKVGLEEVGKHIAQIDVLVLPAIIAEAFGLVVAEANSVGRPAIVTSCGGPAEQVTDGVNGQVVPPNNPVALAAAMQTIVENPQKINEWVLNLPQVRTLEVYVNELEVLYKEVVAGCE